MYQGQAGTASLPSLLYSANTYWVLTMSQAPQEGFRSDVARLPQTRTDSDMLSQELGRHRAGRGQRITPGPPQRRLLWAMTLQLRPEGVPGRGPPWPWPSERVWGECHGVWLERACRASVDRFDSKWGEKLRKFLGSNTVSIASVQFLTKFWLICHLLKDNRMKEKHSHVDSVIFGRWVFSTFLIF